MRREYKWTRILTVVFLSICIRAKTFRILAPFVLVLVYCLKPCCSKTLNWSAQSVNRVFDRDQNGFIDFSEFQVGRDALFYYLKFEFDDFARALWLCSFVHVVNKGLTQAIIHPVLQPEIVSAEHCTGYNVSLFSVYCYFPCSFVLLEILVSHLGFLQSRATDQQIDRTGTYQSRERTFISLRYSSYIQ